MAEKIIGTILLAARHRNYYSVYHLIFTDTRVLAIDANTGQQQGNKSPFMGGAGGWLGQAVMMGAMGGGMSGMAMMNQGIKTQQAMSRWNQVKSGAQGKPVVDYKQTEVTDAMLQLGNVSFPYDKIRSVQVKKDILSQSYTLTLDMGALNKEGFSLVDDAQSQVLDLLQKTSLAQKLKQ